MMSAAPYTVARHHATHLPAGRSPSSRSMAATRPGPGALALPRHHRCSFIAEFVSPVRDALSLFARLRIKTVLQNLPSTVPGSLLA
jgi:hypothetical protein